MYRGSLLICMISCVYLICSSSQEETSFAYNGFGQADLHLDGAAEILHNGLLKLTNTSAQQMGHAFLKQPFEFGSDGSFSFSTHFVCALVPKPGDKGGHGIAFVLSASMDLTHAFPVQYLGLFNATTNGSPSSHLLAVELDTVKSLDVNDVDDNHIGINVNSVKSNVSAPVSYFSDKDGVNKSMTLLSGIPIQVWVDCEGTVVNVSVAPLDVQKPSRSLLSLPVDFSRVFPDGRAFVGFSASTGTATSHQLLLGWSFSGGKGLLQDLDTSKLPRVPRTLLGDKKERPTPSLIVLLVLLGVMGLACLGGAYLYRRNKFAEVKEAWEQEYGPHRFSYRSLYKATDGFNRDCIIGKGGCGEVYRGTLLLERQIAVKRVSHDAAEQGMKQFVAEIVTMGGLKHRNLVPLLGYCRRKGELLLISEYMPNGSLDNYLFHYQKPVLSWPQRLTILRDIASALGYLHTGTDQVVLHRDIKASNVLLDAEFNGRLGDFGMARLHDHGTAAATTAAVGTIGYMAPELTTSGASTSTDVYAFGAFVLEVACGRRPVEPEMPEEKQYLIKWVCECWRRASLVSARDQRLARETSYEEVEMVLKLGLLCTNIVPESRPEMELVVQYLNWSLRLPDFSPHTPGIGLLSHALLFKASSSSSLSKSSESSTSSFLPRDSMFMTHSIIYGGGR